ncbi:ribosomal-protein-alanine N-acetyltransferase [Pedobacter sp. ok626]|uniref:GNAT family N-acetyltransferase n=1 Tax=Pedobacter sp. ok626 TaxID=1761882 RepID=UPI00088BE7D3|nr:GNAT family N-acetyltransferase [Pedobacter sp. ok626]SDJ47574.1 ribosomal-protein-alanine N-acetyltransferase [Pedobacter sp. ok626]
MLQINLPRLPEIETKRLLLREQRLSDAQALFQLRTNTEVMRYIDRPWPKAVRDSEAAIRTINQQFYTGMSLVWAITLKDNPDLMIGNVGYWRTDLANHRAEIGYMLHPDYWRQGILSEGLVAAIDFGFNTVGFHSIFANINPGNDASRQLLLKHNFIKEAYFREDYYFEGKFLDSEIYGLLL